MPLPEGLIDMTIRRATPEQRASAERAMRDKDWRTFYANRDALVLIFANGDRVELTASAPGLNEFLRGMRAAIDANKDFDMRTVRPVGTPLEEWKRKMDEAVMFRPPPRPAPDGPKTVWDRIGGSEEDGF